MVFAQALMESDGLRASAHPSFLKTPLARPMTHPAAPGPKARSQLSWKLTTYGWRLRSSAYQLKVRSPGRLPPLAPI
ncbi:hypothetical protein L833_4086 [Mycobacteroides abscessus MAB_091912_2446]|uniref:Uncharacterized protein n=1 Tax=Mycobacteroides abscessus MAB_091912_2446 TaxID=1335414 RepID=A0A829M6F9_9MYCO|nr:hypothetical protein L833_4086 [Mycobacteroides abscessus MAB_091912_2446]